MESSETTQTSCKEIKKRPFSLDEFQDLWALTEDDLGYTIEAIEKGSLVKGSNDNTNKMYGRIREDALKTIFDIMKLKPSDIFIDLGHGLGCPSVQAAYTRGCTSRGIELDGDRFFISEQLKNGLAHRKELLQQQDVNYVDKYLVGDVEFREGDLSDDKHREFIISANKVFVNNAEDIFGSRSNHSGNALQLDDHIALLFARMQTNTIMVTCSPITVLGCSTQEENDHRAKLGLPKSTSASFFECEYYPEISIGGMSWACDMKPLKAWVYTRTESLGFLCPKKNCEGNTLVTSIIQDESNGKRLFDTCIYCGQKRLPPKRRRKIKQRSSIIGDTTTKSRRKSNVKSDKKETKMKSEDHSFDSDSSDNDSDMRSVYRGQKHLPPKRKIEQRNSINSDTTKSGKKSMTNRDIRKAKRNFEECNESDSSVSSTGNGVCTGNSNSHYDAKRSGNKIQKSNSNTERAVKRNSEDYLKSIYLDSSDNNDSGMSSSDDFEPRVEKGEDRSIRNVTRKKGLPSRKEKEKKDRSSYIKKKGEKKIKDSHRHITSSSTKANKATSDSSSSLSVSNKKSKKRNKRIKSFQIEENSDVSDRCTSDNEFDLVGNQTDKECIDKGKISDSSKRKKKRLRSHKKKKRDRQKKENHSHSTSSNTNRDPIDIDVPYDIKHNDISYEENMLQEKDPKKHQQPRERISRISEHKKCETTNSKRQSFGNISNLSEQCTSRKSHVTKKNTYDSEKNVSKRKIEKRADYASGQRKKESLKIIQSDLLSDDLIDLMSSEESEGESNVVTDAKFKYTLKEESNETNHISHQDNGGKTEKEVIDLT